MNEFVPEVDSLDRSRLEALFEEFRQSGSVLPLDRFVQMLSALFDGASIYVLNQQKELLAHTELGEETAADMEDELSIELGLLANSDDDYSRTISLPMSGHGHGTLWIAKPRPFDPDDEFALGAGCCLLSMLLEQRLQREFQQNRQQRSRAEAAMASLTHTELTMAHQVVKYLREQCGPYPTLPEGMVIASHLADSVGTARSVVVNALSKMQSAEVIEARSLGMKGTWVKVVNAEFLRSMQEYLKPTGRS